MKQSQPLMVGVEQVELRTPALRSKDRKWNSNAWSSDNTYLSVFLPCLIRGSLNIARLDVALRIWTKATRLRYAWQLKAFEGKKWRR
jgi:hypothetical protein